jgi:hypothetical protein
VPIKVQRARRADRVAVEEAPGAWIVIAVGQQHQPGLDVGVVAPLRPVAEDVHRAAGRAGADAVRPVGVAGEEVGGAIEALGDAALGVEGIEGARSADPSGAARGQPVGAGELGGDNAPAFGTLPPSEQLSMSHLNFPLWFSCHATARARERHASADGTNIRAATGLDDCGQLETHRRVQKTTVPSTAARTQSPYLPPF